jgi:Tfp pilus assembly protein FimT
MLRVLVGQRDRLRAKVQELEVALAGARSEAAAAQQQLAAARADNVSLIERLRYVGGYRQQMAAARHSEGADVEAGSGADVVGKYSQLYDEGINPFKEFQVRGC